jgi:hypothetical protein
MTRFSFLSLFGLHRRIVNLVVRMVNPGWKGGVATVYFIIR